MPTCVLTKGQGYYTCTHASSVFVKHLRTQSRTADADPEDLGKASAENLGKKRVDRIEGVVDEGSAGRRRMRRMSRPVVTGSSPLVQVDDFTGFKTAHFLLPSGLLFSVHCASVLLPLILLQFKNRNIIRHP